MRTLLKIALAGALAAVIVKWTRGWLADTSDPAGGRRDVPTINPEPLSAGEPLRGETSARDRTERAEHDHCSGHAA